MAEHGQEIDWRREFANDLKDLREDSTLEPLDLMCLDIGRLYKGLEKERSKYGFLPTRARGSAAAIGALPAESFCERCISAGNLVMNKGNTLLPDDDVDMMSSSV